MEELLKNAFYYKGEEECPFEPNGGGSCFWIMERAYYKFTYEEEHQYWEEGGGYKMALELLDAKNQHLLTGDKFNKTQKGAIANMIVCSFSHNPQGGTNFVEYYGEK